MSFASIPLYIFILSCLDGRSGMETFVSCICSKRQLHCEAKEPKFEFQYEKTSATSIRISWVQHIKYIIKVSIKQIAIFEVCDSNDMWFNEAGFSVTMKSWSIFTKFKLSVFCFFCFCFFPIHGVDCMSNYVCLFFY